MIMYNYFTGDDADFYTDLALERRRADESTNGTTYREEKSAMGVWEQVAIHTQDAAMKIGRPIGYYDTLNVPRLDLLCESELYDVQEEIAKRLCQTLDREGICPERILVLGLGNERLTPDSVGPKSATRVKPTRHIRENDEKYFYALECSEISVFTPGVTCFTGLDSAESTRAICERLCPDVIFAIDSIATRAKARLGTTVQISSTGIFPGGMGNLKTPFTRASLGAPVIGIGVPTVMDWRLFIPKEFTWQDPSPLFVCPREIDEITDNAAFAIGGAINQAFGI
jgi:spore protease